MSYADGHAAIHLEMPPRIPRTEYSAESHWPLVQRVTGRTVSARSPEAERRAASVAFEQAWDYGFRWSTCIFADPDLNEKRTRMGHAAYQTEGADLDRRVECPFTTAQEVLDFDPWAVYGTRDQAALVRRFEDHYRANRAANPEAVNMTGIYITLVSGLIDIFGWDLLLAAAGEDPVAFGAMTDRYASWIQQYFDALGKADVPVVMVHDDIVWTAGPFIRPAWYRQHIFPNYRRLFRPLIESGKRIAYTSDGNFTAFIDDIARCGVHGFVMEPGTDLARIAERYGKTHFFIGNADTRILLSGTREQIRGEVERCLAIGRTCPGYFLAVGNHIPANTPVENALYYDECYRAGARR